MRVCSLYLLVQNEPMLKLPACLPQLVGTYTFHYKLLRLPAVHTSAAHTGVTFAQNTAMHDRRTGSVGQDTVPGYILRVCSPEKPVQIPPINGEKYLDIVFS